MRNRMLNKVLVVLLIVTLISGMMPGLGIQQVYAAGALPAGNGTEDSPYLIASVDNLAWMATNCTLNNGFDGKYFLQTSNINIGASLWTPIGDLGTPFKGVYNGNGKTVLALTVRANATNRQGLFGESSGVLMNLGLTSCDVEAVSSSEVGCLVGRNTGTISGCFSAGRINYSKSTRVGGLVGLNSGTIKNSYSSCDVHMYTSDEIGYSDTESIQIGGLVGYAGGLIANSFATGTVTGYQYVGGLAGYSYGNTFSSFFSGTATPSGGGSVNSFIGMMANVEVSHCRSVAGVGDYLGDTTSNIFDYYQNQLVSSFKTLTTFIDNAAWHGTYPWDMTRIWDVTEGSYPTLRTTRALNTVVYDGNGNTGGTVPTDASSYEQGSTVTVLENTGTLGRTGLTFVGWNTQADGNGTDRVGASTFTMGISDVTLYAV